MGKVKNHFWDEIEAQAEDDLFEIDKFETESALQQAVVSLMQMGIPYLKIQKLMNDAFTSENEAQIKRRMGNELRIF